MTSLGTRSSVSIKLFNKKPTTYKFCKMEKRTFTTEQKLKIINEASEQGVKPILEIQYFPASYSWKRTRTMGTEVLPTE
jgi:hypothetical protein